MALGTVVVAGAGQGAFQLAASLRQEGFDGRVVIVGDEVEPPYQRPPLSKAFLMGNTAAGDLAFRPEAFYRDNRIELVAGERVTGIDRAARRIALGSGGTLAFDHLVLAVGARNRPLPVEGADLDGVFFLRTLADAERLKARIDSVGEAVVVGAGFIGLEFAAVAAKRGIKVTVLEVAPRVMARAVCQPISDAFDVAHRAMGVDLRYGVGAARLLGEAGHVVAVETTTGERLGADLVVVGIGVLANDELAAEAGLATAGGILVDEVLTTADPGISAIGDCVVHPSRFTDRPVRIESVQNAVDQAKAVAARLVGKGGAPYAAVPWFWSDQGAHKLQIAGLTAGADETAVRGEVAGMRFSVFLFRGGRLIGVESVNRPGDHMAARRLLSGAATLTPAEAADESFDLKALVGRPS